MKKISPLFYACAALSLPGICHAGKGILETRPGFRPTLVISDTLTDTVLRSVEREVDPANSGDSYEDRNGNGVFDAGDELITDSDGDGQYDEPVYLTRVTYTRAPMQRLTAKIVASLRDLEGADFDFSSVSVDTPVSIQIGDYSFSGLLGEEQGRGVWRKAGVLNGVPYAAGDAKPLGNSAVYVLGSHVRRLAKDGTPLLDPVGTPLTRFREDGRIRVDWNARLGLVQFTVQLRLLDDGSFGATPSFLATRLADSTGSGKQTFNHQPIPVRVRFGTAAGERLVYGKGIRQASAHRLLPAETPLRSIAVLGAADHQAPKLSRMNVPSQSTDGRVSFSGTLSDRPSPTFPGLFEIPEEDLAGPTLEVYVNGTGVTDENGNVVGGFPVDTSLYSEGQCEFGAAVQLSEPLNTLRLVARDADGNQSAGTFRVRSGSGSSGSSSSGSVALTKTGSGVLVIGPGTGGVVVNAGGSPVPNPTQGQLILGGSGTAPAGTVTNNSGFLNHSGSAVQPNQNPFLPPGN